MSIYVISQKVMGLTYSSLYWGLYEMIEGNVCKQLLYEIKCRHEGMKMQINKQWKELVNELSNSLHNMAGTEQHITSSYQHQCNCLCECQKLTGRETYSSHVKKCLMLFFQLPDPRKIHQTADEFIRHQ